MSKWKTVRLGDVFDLQMGKTPERKNLDFFSTTDNKWISIADISKADKYIFETKEFISDEAVKKSGIKQIPANTVIMSFKLSIGKTAITKGPMYSNEAIMAFLPNGKYEVDNDFLYHLFSNKDWSEGSNKAVKGITLNKASLLEVKILLPPLTIQKQIAKTIDKCTEIISKNKRILEKYDTLTKSRFIEMFGEPVLNPKKWNIEKLKTLTSKIGSGATPKGGRESYISEGISLVRSMNVYKGYFEYEGLAHITEDQARELDNVTLQENDVLINITGASVARCCILPKDVLPARVNQHVSILRATEKLNPVYLSNLLITDTEQRVLLGIGGAGGATREAITKTELETLNIPVPPLSLQNDFASFVQQIDKSKFAVQKSLEKAETLYKSLMQEYFA